MALNEMKAPIGYSRTRAFDEGAIRTIALRIYYVWQVSGRFVAYKGQARCYNHSTSALWLEADNEVPAGSSPFGCLCFNFRFHANDGGRKSLSAKSLELLSLPG